MKQLFPILVAIFATTMILVMYISKEGKPWNELNEEEQRKRLSLLAVFGVIILAACSIIFLVG
jgi:formate hydrogenlyase subunit 3/multisubunit Na+/H+ antiporter MnhD subunit